MGHFNELSLVRPRGGRKRAQSLAQDRSRTVMLRALGVGGNTDKADKDAETRPDQRHVVDRYAASVPDRRVEIFTVL